MKNLLQDNKVPFYLFVLLGISTPLPWHLDRITVVLMFIYSLVSFRKYKFRNLIGTFTFKKAAIPILFVFVHIVGIAYSKDLYAGWKSAETKLALLFVPAFVAAEWPSGLDKISIRRLLMPFVVFCFVTYAYLFLRSSTDFYTNALLNEPFGTYFSRDILAGYLKYHPIYIAMIAACCVQVIIYLLISCWSSFSLPLRLFLLAALGTALLMIVLLGAKMSLIATGVSVLLWLTVLIISLKKYFYGLVLSALLIAAITVSILYIPNIRTRFLEVVNTELEPPRGLRHNSTNLRIGQLYCSLNVIKDNYLMGTGTGDAQDALNSCYKQNDYSDVLYLDSYNSHNQYLQSWLTVGILGLILAISLVLFPISLSFQYQDWLIVTLMVVFLLCMLTESVLQTSKGIMIFSFIYSVFIVRPHNADAPSRKSVAEKSLGSATREK